MSKVYKEPQENKWNYGDSYEKFPIKKGEIWIESRTRSLFAVHDLFNSLPSFMFDADFVYCDPPWSLGNLNSFITKNHSTDYINDFQTFYNILFKQIQAINPRVCFVEIGKQNLKCFEEEMSKAFNYVNTYNVTYYRKNMSYLIRGANYPSSFDYAGKDDSQTPSLAIINEHPICIADLCTGRGLTAISAYKQGKRFVGIELNPRRMAVSLDKISKMGGEICKK